MDLHFYEKLIDYRNRQGMAPQIGAQMTKITEGHAWAELTVQPNQQNLIGSVHGGILMTFADVVAAAAAWSYGRHHPGMLYPLPQRRHPRGQAAGGRHRGEARKTDFRRPRGDHRPGWPENSHLYLQSVQPGQTAGSITKQN